MSSEADLQVYQQRVAEQARNLASYSATTFIRAELPATSHFGEYQLRRDYTAPKSLEFKVIHSAGDAFVKTNVIARLIQSEIDHVQKDDPALTLLSSFNYTFSHKSTTTLDGRPVHVYQVKPRAKRLGLFKGRIYLDAHTGTLVRAEGRTVKSPSLFIKSIHFVQTHRHCWLHFPRPYPLRGPNANRRHRGGGHLRSGLSTFRPGLRNESELW